MRNMAWIVTTGILLCMRTSAVNADQTAVAPPQSSSLLLEVMADGVQIYTCEAKGSGSGFEWSFKAPEASLFDQQGRQIGIHFAGPSWKITDGSEVVGEAVAKADAPDPGAIQWLLLRAKSHGGSGMLSQVAFIRRAETKGGVAPKTGCDANQLSQQARMRYSAIYQFFGAEQGR
jgi:Protein of unknown function (DUF3455)